MFKTSSDAGSFSDRAFSYSSLQIVRQIMTEHFFPRDEYFMRLALREAERALEHDDVPIGAVIVKDGEVIGVAHNERELRGDPTAHAEMIALREAATALRSWRVLDAVLYVTLEPCAMCAGAIVLARMPRVVFGASRSQGRRRRQRAQRSRLPRLNHRPQVGVRAAGGAVRRPAARVLRLPALSGGRRAPHAGRTQSRVSRLSFLSAPPGEVAERLNAPVSKTGIPARVSGVRIPPSPLQSG